MSKPTTQVLVDVCEAHGFPIAAAQPPGREASARVRHAPDPQKPSRAHQPPPHGEAVDASPSTAIDATARDARDDFQTLARCGTGAERVALRNQLVRNNLPLVYAITARMGSTAALPHEDLRQIGSLGLLRAIDAFEPARGRSLSSFAVPYIRGAIQHELRDRFSLMRIPRPLWDLRRRATRLQDQRRRLGTHQLAPTQLAEVLGCPTEHLVEALNVGSVVEMRSLDAPGTAEGGDEGDGRSLLDLLPDPATLPAAAEPCPPSPAWIEALLDGRAMEPDDAAVRPPQPSVARTQAKAQAQVRGDTDGRDAAAVNPVADGLRPPSEAAASLRLAAPARRPAANPQCQDHAPHAEAGARLSWLRTCLLALSPVERSLLVGHVCRGLSWVDLGRELGIKPRQTQRRTLALLQRLQAEGRRWHQDQSGTTSPA